MQPKKTKDDKDIGVSLDDRIRIKELREGLRSAVAAADLMSDLLELLVRDHPEREALVVAISNLYVAGRDLRRALELVLTQEARWENTLTTALIRVPQRRPV